MTGPWIPGKLVVVSLLIVVAMLVGRFATESPRKLLWLDELYTFYQVDGMSLGRFFESLSSGANLMPPVYFFLLWVLGQLVELTPGLLRLVSLLALVGCVPVLYGTLKRVVVAPVAALAIGAVFLTDPMVWDQGVEARPYALGMLLVALLAETLVATAGTELPGALRWCWLAAINFLLPATHYFLGLYSAIALIAVVGVDLMQRRFYWRNYLAFGVGWAVFVISCGPILWRQLANVGAGTGWIRISTRADVWPYAGQVSGGVLWMFAGLTLSLAAARFLRRRGSERGAFVAAENGNGGRGGRYRGQIIFGLGLGWSAFPLVVMVVSGLTKRGLFVDRYFAPSVVGMVLVSGLLGGGLWRQCSEKWLSGSTARARRTGVSALAGVVLGTLIVLAGVRVMRAPASWAPGRERLAEEINALPDVKVSDDEHAYFHALYYGPAGSTCLLICNDDAARARWRIFSDNVQTTSDEELARLPNFVWLSPETRRNASDLASWAARHGYDFQRRAATEPDGVQAVGWRAYYELKRR